MRETEESIGAYLEKVYSCIRASRIKICLDRQKRGKNALFADEFEMRDADLKELFLSLIPKDLSEIVQNHKPEYPHEKLYVFRKDVELEDIDGEIQEVMLYIKINLTKLRSGADFAIFISCHPAEAPMSYYFDR